MMVEYMKIIQVGDTGFSEGYEYKVLARMGEYALIGRGHGGNYYWNYEVHKIRVKKESVIQGNTIEEHEALAKAKDFGIYGWSYPNMELLIKDFPQFKDIKGEVNE
jgi:hypothetical protein